MTMNLNRVTEWERGLPLPAPDELTPLSQSLISPELACAFNIPALSSASTCAVATRSSADVLNASQSAFESLLRMRSVLLPTLESDQNGKAQAAGTSCKGTDGGRAAMAGVTRPPAEGSDQHAERARVSQAEREGGTPIPGAFSSSSPGHDYGSSPGYGISPISSSFDRRPASPGADVNLPRAPPEDREGGGGGIVALRAANLIQLKADLNEEVDSGPAMDPHESIAATMSNEEQSARTLKKPRLVWTPQLHKRFVDAVVHLGIKNAVPKTIMQLMNVDGLTRENVASHLQKYRLYLKRMQGLSNEGPSSSDHLFASTPVPPSLAASAHFPVSQHSHHRSGHPFASVPSPNLPSVIGHRVHHLPSLISSPTLPFSGVDARAGFSNLSRTPPPTSMRSEGVRETYNHQPSSSPRHMLTLFRTSGS